MGKTLAAARLRVSTHTIELNSFAENRDFSSVLIISTEQIPYKPSILEKKQSHCMNRCVRTFNISIAFGVVKTEYAIISFLMTTFNELYKIFR